METEGNQRQITTNNERDNITLTENNQTNKKYNKEKHSRGASMGYFNIITQSIVTIHIILRKIQILIQNLI